MTALVLAEFRRRRFPGANLPGARNRDAGERRGITGPWCQARKRRLPSNCSCILRFDSRPDLGPVRALPGFRQCRAKPCPGGCGHGPVLTNPLSCRLQGVERCRGFVASGARSGGDAGALLDHGADDANSGGRQKQCDGIRL